MLTLMAKAEEFTILIGSQARGTAGLHSDVDVVRVGHKRRIPKKELRRIAAVCAHISYIDYDLQTFLSLHESGSLFIHHIVTEGKLLSGDAARWAKLVESFSVSRDLRAEINEQLRLCRWLARVDKSNPATMPLLSHMFRALKNAAIFSLAQQGRYVYDKQEALRKAFPKLTQSDVELLVTANDAYVRGAPIFTSSRYHKAAAALPDLFERVNSVAGELLRNGKNSPPNHTKRAQKSRGVRLRRRKEPIARRI